MRFVVDQGIVSGVTFLIRWALLPLSLVVGLAALVRMGGPAGESGGDLGGIIRLPRPLTGTILGLFALAAVVLVVGLVRRLRSRRGPGEGERLPETTPMPAWMRTVTQLVSLANVALLAYLVWRGVIPLTDLLNFGQGVVAGIGAAAHQPAVGAPALVTWTFGVLAVVAALGALGLALWLGFNDRLLAWWARQVTEEPPATRAGAEETLGDPRDEHDPRRAIMRCYAGFERVAARSGVARRPWLTPMEFMHEALARLPAPRGAVPTLTTLFELARFSRRPLGVTEKGRAIEALDQIAAAAERGKADVVRG